jgi:hypothetical protein
MRGPRPRTFAAGRADAFALLLGEREQCRGILIRVRGFTPLRPLPADAFAAARPGLRHSRR